MRRVDYNNLWYMDLHIRIRHKQKGQNERHRNAIWRWSEYVWNHWHTMATTTTTTPTKKKKEVAKRNEFGRPFLLLLFRLFFLKVRASIDVYYAMCQMILLLCRVHVCVCVWTMNNPSDWYWLWSNQEFMQFQRNDMCRHFIANSTWQFINSFAVTTPTATNIRTKILKYVWRI